MGVGQAKVDIYALSAFAAGVLNAGSQVVLYNASQKEDVFIMNLWIYTLIALVVVILLPFNTGSLEGLSDITTNSIIIWVCVAIIIFSISSQIFRVKAFKYTNDPALVAPGMYFSVVVAAILDVVFYNYMISYIELCGIVMICVSSILSVIKKY